MGGILSSKNITFRNGICRKNQLELTHDDIWLTKMIVQKLYLHFCFKTFDLNLWQGTSNIKGHF